MVSQMQIYQVSQTKELTQLYYGNTTLSTPTNNAVSIPIHGYNHVNDFTLDCIVYIDVHTNWIDPNTPLTSIGPLGSNMFEQYMGSGKLIQIEPNVWAYGGVSIFRRKADGYLQWNSNVQTEGCAISTSEGVGTFLLHPVGYISGGISIAIYGYG